MPGGERKWSLHTDAVRVALIIAVIAVVVVHGLWPEKFEVDSATVALVVVVVVLALLPWLESASFPGGGGLVFRKKLDELSAAAGTFVADEIASAEAAEDEPDDVTPDSIQRLAADQVVAEVLDQAGRSPKLALMLLSAELERAVHHLLAGTGWGASRRQWALRDGIERLVELGVIPASATSAVALFSQVRNAVVHGAQPRTDDEILRALDSGIAIYNAVAAVPRERNFVSAVDVPLYADEAATQPITDGTGVLLRTVAAGVSKAESERLFPTARDHFRIGEEVAWEWNNARSWGPVWYRHPVTNEILKGPDGSLEFIGRPIDG